MARAKMDVKEAVKLAKEYVADLFAEEQVRDIETEEVKFQHGAKTWLVTVGFFRPWQQGVSIQYPYDKDNNLLRSYKAVRINDRIGRVEWIRDRLMMDPFDPADEFNDTMDAKEVIQTAREYFDNLFAGEIIKNVGLEEVKYDYESDIWEITIGFVRVPDDGSASSASEGISARRSYKTVCINNESGRFEGIKDRFMMDSSPAARE